jgi:hypothetical protein
MGSVHWAFMGLQPVIHPSASYPSAGANDREGMTITTFKSGVVLRRSSLPALGGSVAAAAAAGAAGAVRWCCALTGLSVQWCCAPTRLPCARYIAVLL